MNGYDFQRLRAHVPKQRQTTARERIALLDALYSEVWRRRLLAEARGA